MRISRFSVMIFVLIQGLFAHGVGRPDVHTFGNVIGPITATTFTHSGDDILTANIEAHTFNHRLVAPNADLDATAIVYYDQTTSQMTYEHTYSNGTTRTFALVHSDHDDNNLLFFDIARNSAIVVSTIHCRYPITENCIDRERGILFVRAKAEWNSTSNRFDWTNHNDEIIVAINVAKLLNDIEAATTPRTYNRDDYMVQIAELPTFCQMDHAHPNTPSDSSDHILGRGCSTPCTNHTNVSNHVNGIGCAITGGVCTEPTHQNAISHINNYNHVNGIGCIITGGVCTEPTHQDVINMTSGCTGDDRCAIHPNAVAHISGNGCNTVCNVDHESSHWDNRKGNVGEGLLWDHVNQRLLIGSTNLMAGIDTHEGYPTESVLYSVEVKETPNFTEVIDNRYVVKEILRHDIINGLYFKHLAINPWNPFLMCFDNYAGKQGAERDKFQWDGTNAIQFNTFAENNNNSDQYNANAPSCITHLDFSRNIDKPYIVHQRGLYKLSDNNAIDTSGWKEGFTHNSYISEDELITSVTSNVTIYYDRPSWDYSRPDYDFATRGKGAVLKLDLSYRDKSLKKENADNTYWVNAKNQNQWTEDAYQIWVNGSGVTAKINNWDCIKPWHSAMSPDGKFIISDYRDDTNSRTRLYLWYTTADGKKHCILAEDDAVTGSVAVHPHPGFVNNSTFMYMRGNTLGGAFEKQMTLVDIPTSITNPTIDPEANQVIPLNGHNYEEVLITGDGNNIPNMYVSKYETTIKDWQEIYPMDLPTNTTNPVLPVTNISYYDALAYCNERSKKEGLTQVYGLPGIERDKYGRITSVYSVMKKSNADGYRLPTEAEWLHILGTRFSSSQHGSAIFSPTGSITLTSAWASGVKDPLANGTYDMFGNVWEWVCGGQISGSESRMVSLLGGAFDRNESQLAGNSLISCDSLIREPGSYNKYRGFRMVRNQVVNGDMVVDADSDGMDDKWEAIYHISNPDEDADGDGFTNFEEFEMGSSPAEILVPGGSGVRALYVSPTEVTDNEYVSIMGNPSFAKTLDRTPAVSLTYYDIIEYCNKLSKKCGYTPVYSWTLADYSDLTINLYANGYRLPTREEWEHLYRGGNYSSSTYWNSGNDGDYAWYAENSTKIQPVGLKIPNNYGLYDMAGNVTEWTESGSLTTDNFVMNGSVKDDANKLVYNMVWGPREKDNQSEYRGFRVVRNAPIDMTPINMLLLD